MIVGIIRGATLDNLLPVVEAGFTGGLDQIEITLNSPDALEQIKLVSQKHPVGAGTVLSLVDAKKALAAGAKFIVSPIADPAMIKYCVKKNIPVYPCGVTPNEVFTAWQLGATMVKIFPVKAFGGPAYIREIKAPFNNVKLLACGGVRPENIKEYFAAGASAVAVGNSIFSQQALKNNDFIAIKKAAQKFVQATI